jgi:hypothetical protein
VTAAECRNYLAALSLGCLEITKAAVDGHYEGSYFQSSANHPFSIDSSISIRRFQAMIQFLNQRFEQTMRERGTKYILTDADTTIPQARLTDKVDTNQPQYWTRAQMLEWVGEVLIRCRGKEPVGNFNPLIIGELYWEQSSKWQSLAEQHIKQVADVCHTFLDDLLREKCPRDIHVRLATLKISSALKTRREKAQQELCNVIEDNQEFPAVYNHYYTDTAQKSRNDRMQKGLTDVIVDAISYNEGLAKADIAATVKKYADDIERDMERHSYEEALDYLLAMYKVSGALL